MAGIALSAGARFACPSNLHYSQHVSEDGERLARVEAMLSNLASDVAEHYAWVREQLEGGPNVRKEDSVRGRLHVLEGNRLATEAAARALTEAQRERAVAQHDRRKAERAAKADLWRWLTAVIAVAAIVAPYVHGVFT